MSALADALVAAQRRALTGMEKHFVAGKITEDECRAVMSRMGLADEVEQDRLMWALAAIQTYGASLPAEPTNGTQEATDAPMSQRQSDYIDKLWKERGGKPSDRPDLTGLTQSKASELITQLKTGTYDPAAWSIPF